MATSAKRALQVVEDARDDVTDSLSDHVAALRQEIVAIAEAINEYGGERLHGVQRGAAQLAKDVQHQLPVVARQVSRQASSAGRAVRQDPLPVVVAVGTVVLLAALLFRRD